MPWFFVRGSTNIFIAVYFLRSIVASNETYIISFLVDLWIILFYLGNTENYLVVIDLDYIQIDLLGVLFYCYLYRDSLVMDYSFILFYYCFINNNK
jgi:hypothetical protein